MGNPQRKQWLALKDEATRVLCSGMSANNWSNRMIGARRRLAFAQEPKVDAANEAAESSSRAEVCDDNLPLQLSTWFCRRASCRCCTAKESRKFDADEVDK